ncbi:MAG: type II toxin-antitoxin system VapC family toxin [Actinomycetota bacterium]|nr:type II toxin-antitoxin system VapC family toxin [Actinomycetota bacterium]
MLVVDASVLAPAVGDTGSDGARYRARLRGEQLAGPDLLRLEVLSVLRRQTAVGLLSPSQAERAIDDLLDLPLVILPVASLLRRVWSLRGNLTVYDASYVTVAETLRCPLVTADRRLANAPGSRCPIEII